MGTIIKFYNAVNAFNSEHTDVIEMRYDTEVRHVVGAGLNQVIEVESETVIADYDGDWWMIRTGQHKGRVRGWVKITHVIPDENDDGYTSHPILVSAYNLLGDGQGAEWDLNSEYTRAIVELVSDTVGAMLYPDDSIDRGGDEWRRFVLGVIRKAGEPNEVNPWEQSYEDYCSDSTDQHGIPDGLSREDYEVLQRYHLDMEGQRALDPVFDAAFSKPSAASEE